MSPKDELMENLHNLLYKRKVRSPARQIRNLTCRRCSGVPKVVVACSCIPAVRPHEVQSGQRLLTVAAAAFMP